MSLDKSPGRIINMRELKAKLRAFLTRNNHDWSEKQLDDLVEELRFCHADLEKSEQNLQERIKELTCLYQLFRLTGQVNLPLDELMQQVVNLIPPAWQYPEITCARLIFDAKTYHTHKFEESAWSQAVDIWVDGQQKGTLEVFYLEKEPETDEGPFLKEERSLLDAIGAQLSAYFERRQAEDRIRIKEEKLRITLQSIGDAVIATDVNGLVVRMNPVAEQLTGWKLTEAKGRPLDEVFRIENAETGLPAENPVAKVLATGQIVGLANHTKLTSKNGKEYQISDSGSPIVDDGGKISGVVLVFRDVTEEYQLHQALRESETGFRLMFENNPQPMWIYDLETLAFLKVNQAALSHYGYSEAEFYKMTIKDIRPEADLDRLNENLQQEGQIMERSGQWRHLKKDGSLIDVEISSHSVVYNKRPARHVLILDVTDRVGMERRIRESEQVLRENEERFRAIVEGAPDPIFIQSQMNFAYLNPAACRFFRINSRDELIGKPVMERFHPEYHAKIKTRIARLNAGQPVEELFEQRFIRMDGTEVWGETAGDPIVYEGIASALVFVRDISQRKASEQALRESEARWQFALEGAGDGIWDWNLQSDEIFFSDQWKRMLGYEPNEVPNEFMEWQTRVHPDDLDQALKDVQKHIDGETEVYLNEHRLRGKDGSYRWVLGRGKIISHDEQGKPLRFVGIHSDITERKEAEHRLQITQFGIDHAQVGIYQVEEDGTITYANHYAAKTLGYSMEELLGKSLFDIAPPFDPESFHQHRLATKAKGSNTIISRHKRKDGTEFPVEVTVNYFQYKDQTLSFSFVKDITERQRAEEALKESEANYRMLVENQTDIVVKVDLEGRFLFVSPSYCKMFGKTEDELIGKTFMPLVHPDDQEQTAEAMKSLFYPPHRAFMEQRALTQQGWVWLAWSDTAVLNDEGKVSAIIGVGRDITERKLAETDLRELKEQLEVQVDEKTKELRERIQELQRFHDATIEREFRIKELRDEIAALKGKRL